MFTWVLAPTNVNQSFAFSAPHTYYLNMYRQHMLWAYTIAKLILLFGEILKAACMGVAAQTGHGKTAAVLLGVQHLNTAVSGHFTRGACAEPCKKTL